MARRKPTTKEDTPMSVNDFMASLAANVEPVAAADLPKRTRNTNSGPNPFDEAVLGAYESGDGFRLTVPGSALTSVYGRIRNAGASRELSTRITIFDSEGEKVSYTTEFRRHDLPNRSDEAFTVYTGVKDKVVKTSEDESE